MKTKYTVDILAPIIKSSSTWAEVCRQVGVKPMTGAQYHIKKVADSLLIDYSHFLGQGWRLGKHSNNKKAIESFLVEHSTAKSSYLRDRLIKEGYKDDKCEMCGLTEWLSKKPPLELDHINRVHDDCRIENLQVLCANCHAIKTRMDRSKPA